MENTHIKSEEPPSVTSNNETATVAASTDNTVTSSSPTSTFQPFQQLHEAVLAAVNSNSATLPSSFLSAAVAAAQANNVAIHPHPQQIESALDHTGLDQHQQQQRHVPDIDIAKKESIRASNRERKKKWRIHNEERNKDNDLRCRVNKRATKLYGPSDSPAKQKWINEEFEKRRQKRMEKERRKHLVNNVLSVPSTTTPSGDAEANNRAHAADNNGDNVQMSGIGQIPNYYTPLPQIDTATAAKLLDFPTDLQRQLLEQLNNSMLALTNGIQQAAAQPGESSTDNNTNETNNETQINPTSQFPDNAVTNEALQQVIAQGLSTNTTSAASSSGHNSPMQYSATTNTSNDMPEIKEEGGPSTHVDETPKEEGDKETKEEETKEGKKPEYPMDAVLTLMQLNAGWRQ
ncbi:uncharacterized protein B0P05DRAFT_584589 [Gilbertella persicaria]|uniref:DUF3020 domain-containing protein n=1 Tax=Rhizopus stolonifer TaxID=4846 RepID=A0A367KMH8_RHIST|nr:uncharacterized protein B0P05DRAFT_584589 [Gilbertella persicaria]KAI8087886.1 hypothetical protein B0P05DRAFT_584589 [Gilbertella persicaria]RCI03406.1 hypothetical protein CU098_005936 [Rhizopus stolonifer]